MSKWYWVYGTDRQILRDMRILPDGSLHDPNGYPEDEVRAGIAAAEESRRQRRSKAAKKAAVTRRKRRERDVYGIAEEIIEGEFYVPGRLVLCADEDLVDAASIERGIGSECWDGRA